MLVVIFIMILLMAWGCVSEEAIYVDDVNDESKISIYLLIGEKLDNLVEVDYLITHMYTFHYKRWIDVSYFTDPRIMYDRILNEMYQGGGPDIIIINSVSNKYLNLYKLSEINALADMDKLIANSEIFKMEDYNKAAMDAGIVQGKRILLPMEFGVNYCVAIEETFDHHGIEMPETLTMSSYLDTLEEYYSKVEERPAMLGFDEERLLAQFYTEGEYLEKSEELKRLLDVIKIERDRSRYGGEYDLEGASWTSKFIEGHQWFYDNHHLYLGAVEKNKDVHYRMFHLQYNTIDKFLEKTVAWFPLPCREGEQYEAYVENGFVINNNSKHKNEAFKFLEIILGMKKQITSNTIHFPVRNECLTDRSHDFMKGLNLSYTMPGVFLDMLPDESIPDDVKLDFIDYVEGIENYEYIGHFKYVYNNLMKSNIEDYFKGYITYEKLIDEINNKLMIYYTE